MQGDEYDDEGDHQQPQAQLHLWLSKVPYYVMSVSNNLLQTSPDQVGTHLALVGPDFVYLQQISKEQVSTRRAEDVASNGLNDVVGGVRFKICLGSVHSSTQVGIRDL